MWRRPLSRASRFSARGELRCQSGPLRLTPARSLGLSLDDRLQRRLHGGAPGQAAGPLLSLPVPHHHELHADLPQGRARGPRLPVPPLAGGARGRLGVDPGVSAPRRCAQGPAGADTAPPEGSPAGFPRAGRGFLLGSAGFALTASTGSRGGCGPPARGLCPPRSALCPLPAAHLGALLA